MKQLVKRALYSLSPRWTTELMSARARAFAQKTIASWGCGPLNRKLVERFGNRVLGGPFAGLALTETALAEQVGPFLLGVYESELDAAWELVFRGSYTQIIDIGSSFGYYAVGLATKFPTASVVAFDTDWWARSAVREMAAANRAENVEVKGYCSPDWIARHTREPALILSDCEGFEAALFGPQTMPALRSATLLIETHNVFVPGVSDRLQSEFRETHDVRVIGHDEARRPATVALDFLTEDERRLATHEVRSRQTWLLCLPRTGPNRELHQTPTATASAPTA